MLFRSIFLTQSLYYFQGQFNYLFHYSIFILFSNTVQISFVLLNLYSVRSLSIESTPKIFACSYFPNISLSSPISISFTILFQHYGSTKDKSKFQVSKYFCPNYIDSLWVKRWWKLKWLILY